MCTRSRNLTLILENAVTTLRTCKEDRVTKALGVGGQAVLRLPSPVERERQEGVGKHHRWKDTAETRVFHGSGGWFRHVWGWGTRQIHWPDTPEPPQRRRE